MMSGLHVDSVVKNFGLRLILSDIFISCKQGEIIGLLGRNGSGKSSLLKIIFGTLTAENKFITVDDQHVNNLFDRRNLIHYLPQDNFLPNHINIKSIISLFCTPAKAALLIELDLIKPLIYKKSKQLSGGERRIVEILLMIYSEAKYLLLDEPFNGLAPIYLETIKDIIKKHSANKGFIITDHHYQSILDISTTVILLHDGGTKKIKDHSELIAWGYLPVNSIHKV